MNNLKVTIYLETLLQLKKVMLSHDNKGKDKIWIEFYEKTTCNGVELGRLPELLALIHPDFYYKNGISFEENIPWEKNKNFVKSIMNTDKCQADIYTGNECIFNMYPDIRGKCQADHKWPNSLGGPSVLDNRMILCKYHNAMKSNDIYFFSWNSIPSWLPNYISLIYRLKL